LQFGPRTCEFNHTEQSQGAQGLESLGHGTNLLRSECLGNSNVDEGESHNDGIEKVEIVANVVFDTKTHHFHEHFSKEGPSEEIVEVSQNLLFLKGLWEVINCENHGIDENQHKHNEVVHWVSHSQIETAIATVFL